MNIHEHTLRISRICKFPFYDAFPLTSIYWDPTNVRVSGIVCKYQQFLSRCDCRGPRRLWGALWAKQTMENVASPKWELLGTPHWRSVHHARKTFYNHRKVMWQKGTIKWRISAVPLLVKMHSGDQISSLGNQIKSDDLYCLFQIQKLQFHTWRFFYYLSISCIDTMHFTSVSLLRVPQAPPSTCLLKLTSYIRVLLCAWPTEFNKSFLFESGLKINSKVNDNDLKTSVN